MLITSQSNDSILGIYVGRTPICNSGMENKDIRRQNLLLLVKEHGTLKSLADATDSAPAHLSQIKNGMREMGDAVARRIEAMTNKPRGWMDTLHEEEKDKAFGNVRPAPMDIRRIPVISYVQAGNPKEVINDYAPGTGMAEIWTDLELGPDAFALIIEGDSMEPDFKAGDKVLIDPSVQPRAGQYVVAKCPGEEATFKRYRPRGRDQEGNDRFELVPLNDAYGPILSDTSHPCMIIGTMVEHRRYGR